MSLQQSSRMATQRLLKMLLHELRIIERIQTTASPKTFVWRNSPVYKHLIVQPSDSFNNTVLKDYVTLLQASRKAQEINTMYKGRGERSIEDTAKLVGLKLPQLYNDPS